MAELINHGHCEICGRAVRYGEKTCGPGCQEEQKTLTKKRSRTVLLFYVGAAVLLVLLLSQLLQSFL